MKKILTYIKVTKSIRLNPIRTYRGKYLTSYQKRISTNEKKTPMTLNTEPIDFIAGISISKEIVYNNDDVMNHEIKDKDLELIEASKLYLSSDVEFRKLLFYGTENPKISSTEFFCHGCGSNINCQSITNPGYIPFEVLKANENNKSYMENILCIRCFYLYNDLDPIDISLDEDPYHKILSQYLNHYESSVVIVLADMSDLPNSIPPDLGLDKIRNLKIILVGNKIDLLTNPNKNLQWYKECLMNAAEQRGISKDQVEFVHLLSAKTCQLFEDFIDQVLSFPLKNEPIFLLGSTNTGKSSVFNRLLKSDLCKTIAKTHIKDALISNLPGTTLNILKFPITNSTSELKSRRLKAKYLLSRGEMKSSVNTNYSLIESSTLINMPKSQQHFEQMTTYSYNKGTIYSNKYDEHHMRLLFDNNYLYDPSKITTNRWFHDTPGFINPDQIINYLSKEYVDKLYKVDDISKPQIYVLKAGLSIIMDNLGRIDIVECPQHVYLCTHLRIPVEIVDTCDIDRYLTENTHFTNYRFKENLSPSLVSRIRSRVPDYCQDTCSMPILVPVDMDIITEGYHVTSADVLLSSLGWVGVSGPAGSSCIIRAWTPAAIGCGKRIPSILPGDVKRRTRRKAHSREFQVS